MNIRRSLLLAAAAWPAGGHAQPLNSDARQALVEQLRAAETAFAATMARRDFAAFAAHVSPDAVFINGTQPLRGKDAVLAHWKRFFAEPAAPFAWQPEIAEVTGDGQLGYTEGPVSSPAGVVFARFFSTWRRGGDGRWQVVFDNGTSVCKA